MKKIIINIILVFCSVLSYAQHQDTIEFGEGGYWLPNNDYRVFGCRTSMPVNFCGNIYKPDSNVRILGLSCFADSLKGNGATLVLAKYVGPDSVLSDSIIQARLLSSNSYSQMYYHPQYDFFEIIDSVRLYAETTPTRYYEAGIDHGHGSEINKVYDAFFDSVITMNDSSIYFVYFKHYPDFANILQHWYWYYDPYDFGVTHIGEFITEGENCITALIDIGIHGYEDADTIEYHYNNPRDYRIESKPKFYAVFPIIEDEYDLEVHYACPPPGRPTVTVDRRRAAFEWEGDSAYCAYELAYGGAGEDRSAYTTIVTTADTCSVMTLLPGERYACRLRGLCCSSDGDSVWSVWSDTVQFERMVYTVTGRSNNISIGYVQGTRTVDVGDTVELRAIPRYEDVRFLQWTGGDTVNPLRVVAVCDTTVMAYFQRYVDTTQPPDTTVVEGIEEAIERGIVLRPNPAWEEVTVESSEPIVGIEVCDLWGREVQRQTVPSAGEVTIGVGGLRSGVYIVRVRTSQGCAIRKLVVKRRSEK